LAFTTATCGIWLRNAVEAAKNHENLVFGVSVSFCWFYLFRPPYKRLSLFGLGLISFFLLELGAVLDLCGCSRLKRQALDRRR
jgi:hypothetical protein